MQLSSTTKIALGGLGLAAGVGAAGGVRSFYRRSMNAMYPQNYTPTNAGNEITAASLASQPAAINGMKFSFRRR